MSKKRAFQFLESPREMPRKIPLQLRTGGGDWNELYGHFDPDNAAHQAGRVSTAALDCSHGCPCTTTPQWLRLVDEV